MHPKLISILSYIITKRKKLYNVVIVTTFVIMTYQCITRNADHIYNVINSFKSPEDFIFDYFEEASDDPNGILSYKNFTEKEESDAELRHNDLPLCPDYPPNLRGNLERQFYLDFVPPEFSKIKAENPQLSLGGSYAPKNCKARHRVAIIIPLRGRERQLKVLLSHMHPILQRQQLDYTVYVMWQAGNNLFNKAKLMNSGFLEVSKDRQYDCYIFHDVDMLLENDKCLYWCPGDSNPRQVSVYIDKFYHRYKWYQVHCHPSSFPHDLPVHYFGGVSMVTKKQFYDVNGYSNIYWGWGGEDDDMFIRLWSKGYKIKNPYGENCSYHMIQHKTEHTNAENEGRYALMTHTMSRMKYEGLNTLRYKVLSFKKDLVFTNITIDVGQPTEDLLEFMSKTFNTWTERCFRWMPWYFRQ